MKRHIRLGVFLLAAFGWCASSAAEDPYADPEESGLPQTDVAVDNRTALAITDPQIDFLNRKA